MDNLPDLTPYLTAYAPALSLVAVAAFLLALIALIWVIVLQRRLSAADRWRRQMETLASSDVQTMLQRNIEGLTDASYRIDHLEVAVKALTEQVKYCVQYVGVVRFNPYHDTGGDQSFAIAMLDDHSDGLVMTGMHSRNGVRLYAKPVARGRSTYPLSDEERRAIEQAGARVAPAPAPVKSQSTG
ncbi:MAG: DUF4446 family protein [Anaerolineae bacterium]